MLCAVNRQHPKPGGDVELQYSVLQILDDTLGLAGRAHFFDADTPLLGALPELDSMAVAGILAALEDTFGIAIDDESIDARAFATVGSLTEWVMAQRS
ncbi:MAG: hypothetical protein RIR70_1025 [Pseudomonadota bacterium]|jgi:acyl carrier protein